MAYWDWVSRLGLAYAVVLILGGCTSNRGLDPIAAHYFDTPHVNGIWMYNADGVSIGAWGRPWELPRTYPAAPEISRAYPNPAVAVSTHVTFWMPASGYVWVWIVRAVGPAEIEAQFVKSGGASVQVPGGAPCSVLWRGDHLPAGEHRVVIDVDPGGSPRELRTGFYRIYLYVEDDTGSSFEATKDLLFIGVNSCEAIPWEFREYVGCLYP